jgi:hypothetical protein
VRGAKTGRGKEHGIGDNRHILTIDSRTAGALAMLQARLDPVPLLPPGVLVPRLHHLSSFIAAHLRHHRVYASAPACVLLHPSQASVCCRPQSRFDVTAAMAPWFALFEVCAS